jgi:hypothetical protein
MQSLKSIKKKRKKKKNNVGNPKPKEKPIDSPLF